MKSLRKLIAATLAGLALLSAGSAMDAKADSGPSGPRQGVPVPPDRSPHLYVVYKRARAHLPWSVHGEYRSRPEARNVMRDLQLAGFEAIVRPSGTPVP